MVIDSSALIAIVKDEPEAVDFVARIVGATMRLMSAVSVLEVSLVLAGRRGDAESWRVADAFRRSAEIDVAPFDEAAAALAREAFLRFGKGRHPAALNMGDCAAYALAKSRGLPLLCKGGEFSRTDVAVTPPPTGRPSAGRLRHGL